MCANYRLTCTQHICINYVCDLLDCTILRIKLVALSFCFANMVHGICHLNTEPLVIRFHYWIEILLLFAIHLYSLVFCFSIYFAPNWECSILCFFFFLKKNLHFLSTSAIVFLRIHCFFSNFSFFPNFVVVECILFFILFQLHYKTASKENWQRHGISLPDTSSVAFA